MIDDMLDTMGGMKFFSLLNLTSGYWQIGMDCESRAKSVFILHTPKTVQVCSHTIWNVQCCCYLSCILSGMIWKSYFAYIDDVLVGSCTFEEHLNNLQHFPGYAKPTYA